MSLPTETREKYLTLWCIAGLVLLLVMKFAGSDALWLGLCALPVCLPEGLILAKSAALGLWRRHELNEQALMLTAACGALALGDYPEAAAVLCFYNLGEHFEAYAARRAREAIGSAASLRPAKARVVNADGSTRDVRPSKVSPGDLIRVLPGEVVALDGVLIDEAASFDASALTGESLPKTCRQGDEVPSGCISADRAVTLRAVRPYRDGTLSRLLNLIEDAAARKARSETMIRRMAVWYTPCVVGIAVFLALVPAVAAGAQWQDWLNRALVFLVVSCPCAMVLSVPLTFFAGAGALAGRGVMVKGGIVLERLAAMRKLGFDKTGTLTRGSFTVERLYPAPGVSEGELLAALMTAEQSSTHPLAQAVTGYCIDRGIVPEQTVSVTEKAGLGVLAVTESAEIRAGCRGFVAASAVLPAADAAADSGLSLIHAAAGDRYLGAAALDDGLRPEAKASLEALGRLGIEVFMASGDSAGAAARKAAMLGISECHGGLSPQDKLSLIGTVRETGGITGFTGDGINDAPVLAAADIGIAMGVRGSGAALEHADMILMHDDLGMIAAAVRHARKTCRVAWENILLSLGIKIGILLLGAFGFASLWLAVFGDVGTLILAVFNALRAGRMAREADAPARIKEAAPAPAGSPG